MIYNVPEFSENTPISPLIPISITEIGNGKYKKTMGCAYNSPKIQYHKENQ